MSNIQDYEKIIEVDIFKLKPHPENEKILPKLTAGELKRLKDRIKKFGFTEPIEINQEGLVLDGNNRIFKVLIPYQDELKIYKVPARKITITKSEEINYIISKNFDRRQLSKMTQSYIRGVEYNSMKDKRGGDKRSKYQNDTLKNTAQNLSHKYHVSVITIKRDGSFAKICDKLKRLTGDEFVFNLLNGEIKSNKSIITQFSKYSDQIITDIFKAYKELNTELELPALKLVMEKVVEENIEAVKKKNDYKKKLIEINTEYERKLIEIAKKKQIDENKLINEIIEDFLKKEII